MDIPSAHRLNRLLSNRMLLNRMEAGLDRSTRLRLQLDCDSIVAQVRSIDDQLDDLSTRRRSLTTRLGDIRDELYPPIAWKRGRRPPTIDGDMLPPVVDDPDWLWGRRLRSVCLTLLRLYGTVWMFVV